VGGRYERIMEVKRERYGFLEVEEECSHVIKLMTAKKALPIRERTTYSGLRNMVGREV